MFRFPYRFRNTYPGGQPSPGANGQAFQAFQDLPKSSYFGAGIPVKWSWSPYQPKQLYVLLAVPFEGVTGTGVVAGQLFTTQLLDPNAPPYPAYES
jgi:hypothetical protein